ncbi:MAG: hypothetical protein KJN71_03035 [Acidimicrobiia bacterium]|nr:hypothetical protein [Acidimicrobiia bacterium]
MTFREPNRWTRLMKSRAKTQDAVAMFVFYIGGTLLTIAAVITAAIGLLHVIGDLGSGAGGRVLGVVILLASGVAMAAGVWMTRTYRIEERR